MPVYTAHVHRIISSSEMQPRFCTMGDLCSTFVANLRSVLYKSQLQDVLALFYSLRLIQYICS